MYVVDTAATCNVIKSTSKKYGILKKDFSAHFTQCKVFLLTGDYENCNGTPQKPVAERVENTPPHLEL